MFFYVAFTPSSFESHFCVSGKFWAPCTADSHVMMATPIAMQATYANFPQQAWVTFQTAISCLCFTPSKNDGGSYGEKFIVTILFSVHSSFSS